MEFNFFPNVLESIVDVRVVQRTDGGWGGSAVPTPQAILAGVQARMGWVQLRPMPPGPLDAAFSKRANQEFEASPVCS